MACGFSDIMRQNGNLMMIGVLPRTPISRWRTRPRRCPRRKSRWRAAAAAWDGMHPGANTLDAATIVKLVRTGGKPTTLGLACWVAIALVSLGMQHVLGIW